MPAAKKSPARTDRPDDAALLRTGLTQEQVAERTQRGLANAQPDHNSRSVWAIVRTHLFTLFNLVLGLCALVIVVLGRWLDILFSLSALTNIIIGFVQEFSAKRQLDRIALLRRDPVRVLRDGSVQAVPLETLVQDDVVLLRRGDQVPADAEVLSSDGLDLDESLLTGENDPVTKNPGDRVLSASSVVNGSGRVRLSAVGAKSHASRLAQEARQYAPLHSELRQAMGKVVRWISVALVPIIVVVLNGQMQAVGGWSAAFRTDQWQDTLVVTVSSVASMIPQGLALMTTISFAVAAVKLAQDEVLIQEQPAVEVLARVDMLCFDKTGTLTQGGIAFDAVHALPDGPSMLPEEARSALAWLGADDNGNPTSAALAEEFVQAPAQQPVRSLAFSSDARFSGVEFPDSGAWLLGAPEALLDAARHAPARRQAAELAASGLRTLVVGRAAHLEAQNGRSVARLPQDLEPLALVTFREEVREDAAETLAYFAEQDVAVKVFSGDSPATVAAAARLAGMPDAEHAVDASELPEEGPELAAAVQEHQVFGRVSPHQKKNMVLALQEAGHVVAMTGDGINDALALKHADLGIAMGNAAPATKAVSRMVLLDGKFSRLPAVIAEGRKLIANIERVTHLFLTKTTFAVFMGVALGLLAWTFPFLPRQYSTADLLMIGGPSFVLTMLPNSRRYVGGFLRRALHFALPSAVVVTAGVVAVNAFARFADDAAETTQQVQTASFVVLVLLGLWILCVGSRPLVPARLALVVAMYLGLVLVVAVPWSQMYHQFQLPHRDLFLVAVATAAVGSALIEANYRLHVRWLRRRQPRAFAAGRTAGEI